MYMRMCDYMLSVFLCAAHTIDLFINGAPAEATDASVPPVVWVSWVALST